MILIGGHDYGTIPFWEQPFLFKDQFKILGGYWRVLCDRPFRFIHSRFVEHLNRSFLGAFGTRSGRKTN
jgi:hypothetical protein